MPLTAQHIARIADLAKLGLSDAEAGCMLTQLNDFFAIVEKMRAVDATAIAPLAHPVCMVDPALALRLREDRVSEEPGQRAANQQNAPAVERGLFLVPKVIE